MISFTWENDDFFELGSVPNALKSLFVYAGVRFICGTADDPNAHYDIFKTQTSKREYIVYSQILWWGRSARLLD